MIYVRKYFDKDSKKPASGLAHSIHAEFIRTLQNVSWMDEGTKAAAIEKAQSTIQHIGYPNELDDNRKLEEYYDGLELDPESYLQNVLRIRRFDLNRLMKKFREPVDRSDWESLPSPAVVSSYYARLTNSIGK